MTGNNTGTYVLGQGGQELTQLSGSGAWQRTNVFAGGRQLATYDMVGASPALHFQLTDPLGTRRMQTSSVGQPETDIQSLPYGDQLSSTTDPDAPVTADDATPLHFTGKERDPETGEANGNDYFGARYYASLTGRFLTPDWAPKAEPVPYAVLGNPQSLNLYNYVHNNPLSSIDPDGHDDCADHNNTKQCSEAAVNDTGQDGGGDGFLASEVVSASVNNGKVTYAPQSVTAIDPNNCPMSNAKCRMELQAIMARHAERPQTNAPNNNQPQPQKKHCKATTRIGGVIKAADGYITATAMANLAGLGYYGAFFIVGATCAPQPGVFVTCPAGLFAGGSLAGSATVMSYGAYKAVTEEMIPGIKQAVTCTETE